MMTDRFVRNAAPGVYSDADGLYLRVLKSGTRTFVLRRRVDGRDKWETLGKYPVLSLADAREQVHRIQTGTEQLTVRQAWERYYAHLQTQYKDPAQTQRMVEKNVLCRLGKEALFLLDRAKWMETINRVVQRGSPIMANRLLSQVRRFLDYAEQQGWIDENPLERVKRTSVGGKERPATRNLSWDEIEALLRLLRCPKHDTSVGTRWALYLCLLTGQRPSEVLGFRNTTGAFMTGSTKTTLAGEVPYKVPLTPHVRAAMKFFSQVERPRDHRVLSHALRRLEQDFTPHKLRHTMSSRMADLGVMPHVVEKMLNHKMVGSMAVYNHAEYWRERVEAQKLWGRKLAELRRKKVPGELGSTPA